MATPELQGVALQNDNSMLRMQCGLGSYSCCDNLLGILLRHPSRAAATRGRNNAGMRPRVSLCSTRWRSNHRVEGRLDLHTQATCIMLSDHAGIPTATSSVISIACGACTVACDCSGYRQLHILEPNPSPAPDALLGCGNGWLRHRHSPRAAATRGCDRGWRCRGACGR